MEGVGRVDKTEFTECWRTSWKTPYIMRLAFSAGLGGLLFGYDTGNMMIFYLVTQWLDFLVSVASSLNVIAPMGKYIAVCETDAVI